MEIPLIPALSDVVIQYLTLDEMEDLDIPITDAILINLVGPKPLTVSDFIHLSTTPMGLNTIQASIYLGEIPTEFLTDASLYAHFPATINANIIRQLLPQYDIETIIELAVRENNFTVQWNQGEYKLFPPRILTVKTLNRIVKHYRSRRQFWYMAVSLFTLSAKIGAHSAIRRVMRVVDRNWIVNLTPLASTLSEATFSFITRQFIKRSSHKYELLGTLLLLPVELEVIKRLLRSVLANPWFDPAEIMLYLEHVHLRPEHSFIFEWVSHPPFNEFVDWAKLLRRTRHINDPAYVKLFKRLGNL